MSDALGNLMEQIKKLEGIKISYVQMLHELYGDWENGEPVYIKKPSKYKIDNAIYNAVEIGWISADQVREVEE